MLTTLSQVLRSGRLFAQAMYQRRVPYLPIGRLHAIQQERMRRIVRHAYQTVPFYREAMGGQNLRPEDFRTAADLARLPLIDRKFVRENQHAFQSSEFDPRDCVALHSGGGATTYWDQESSLARLAHAERERVVWLQAGHLGFGHRQLHILSPSASSLTARNFWDRKVKTPRFVAQRHFIDALQPYQTVVEALERIRPAIAFSYGSYLEHFAAFLRDRGLRPPMPKIWVYGADAMSTYWRDYVTREFGCAVFANYAATETGRIGFQCERRDGFHLNIDLCAVRIVKDDGSEAGPGEIGEVVVSNLLNRAMVLLNYRLEDLAEAAGESCPCGRSLPLLSSLHGRVSESVETADGTRLSATVLLGKFALELQNTLKVQVVSLEPGRITWRIVPSRTLDREQFQRRLLDRCREVFGTAAIVELEYLEDIPATPRGKFRSVIRSSEHTV